MTDINNMQASIALTEYVPTVGVYPVRDAAGGDSAFTLGMIGIFAGNYPAAGALAQGQLLSIQQNTALYSILGINYGGNGTTNYALPNLAGTTMVGVGAGPGTSGAFYYPGTREGTASVSENPGAITNYDNYQPSLGVTYEIAVTGTYAAFGVNSLDAIGTVAAFAGNYASPGFLPADGRLLSISQYGYLFAEIGTTYGGNGTTTFALPDLRGRTVIGAGYADPLGSVVGQSTVHLTNHTGTIDNEEPSLALNYLIAVQGIYPNRDVSAQNATVPVLGQIIAYAGSTYGFDGGYFVPADGRLLPIAQYQALYSLLGTTYGGDGRTTFALPDLRNKTVIGTGTANGTYYTLGQQVGANSLAQPVLSPAITSEKSTSSAGSMAGAGDTVTFTLGLNEAVAVVQGSLGAPFLQLNDGKVADYTGPFNTFTTQLTFSTTFVPQDYVNDLQATSLGLRAGDLIQDAAGNRLDVTSFTPIDTGVHVCFCKGTRIQTPSGEVAVEDLRPGDAVTLQSGKAEPVAWIGRGQVLVTAANRGEVAPVVVRAGALAEGVPHRDLRLTPGHSLLVDEVLIPVIWLVNGRSILRDERAQLVEFYHVELERHDVLLADGAPAESYREDRNEMGFANAASRLARPGLPSCAPIVESGPVLEAAWQRLYKRSNPPEMRLTQDPDLHLIADGARLNGERLSEEVYLFRLERTPSSLAIGSRSMVPASIGLGPDWRRLGVPLRRMVFMQPGTTIEVAHDSTWLGESFHGPEDDFRWSKGEGLVPPAAFKGFAGPFEVEVHIAVVGWYAETDDVKSGTRSVS